MKRSRARAKADGQPILNAIVKTAARLCDANYCHLYLAEGGFLRNVAKHGSLARSVSIGGGFPIGRGSVAGLAVHDRRTVHVRDLKRAVKSRFKDARMIQRAAGLRTMLATPLLLNGQAIGALVVLRRVFRPFTAHQIALLKSFAEQATIALENARLSRELAARNSELTEALGRETATGAILGVISRSPTDIEPVLTAVAESAARLCHAYDATVFRLEGNVLRLAAHHGPVMTRPTVPVSRGTVGGRSILEARPIQVADAQAEASEFPEGAFFAREIGHRTVLSVPLLREGVPVGAIHLRRTEVAPFTDTQIALLQTFADQAVIAIENVRLFTELQQRNRDLTDALEQQIATAEILGAISGSPTDLGPVLETVVHAAAKFCNAPDVAIVRTDGGTLRMVAAIGPFGEEMIRRAGSLGALQFPISRESVTGRAVVDRRSLHVHDLAAEPEDEYPVGRDLQRRYGHRTMLATPLLREGVPVGAMILFRTEVNPFSEKQVRLSQTFADQAVIAIENVRLFTELQARNHDLTEALEQQTATSDILQVISSSPTDLQPVFDIIAESAVKLCSAEVGLVVRLEGEWVHAKASYGTSAAGLDAIRSVYPMRLSGAAAGARAIRDGAVAHIPDVMADAEYKIQQAAITSGFRAALGVPMMREGRAIGSITIGRAAAGEFSERQIALLQTFADQAVIAIENVRLFTELTDSLTQQTATAEILKVISSSPTDIQPVLDAITESAARLCEAIDTAIFLEDGEELRLATHQGPIPLGPTGQFTVPRVRGTLTGRAALEQRTIQLADHQAEAADYPEGTAVARRLGVHTMLAVPLLRSGKAIGVIALRRTEIRPFTDQQVALLQTFADQAVIAIENVRLFTELEKRNRDLTEALEQQTATSEILQVISGSHADLQPVFDIIAESAARLCSAEVGVVTRLAGEWVELKAVYGSSPEGADALRRVFPMRPTGAAAAVRAIRDAAIAHIPDVLDDREYENHDAAIAAGFRAALAVPLLRDGRAIGSLGIGRSKAGEFSEQQIKLLSTFADQALIAIENVRLFTELGARNQELTDSLTQQTATAEILRVISSSPTDIQPVLDAVVESAARLCEAVDSQILLVSGDHLHVAAHHGPLPVGSSGRRIPIIRGTLNGRAVLEARTVYVEDLQAEAHEFPEGSAIARELGHRTVLTVPMLREGVAVGTIAVRRAEVRPFSERQIALLQTFADQAVIAIENVRLFTELGVRNRDLTESLDQQTATSEILRVISQSPTDVQPVFDAIARNARRLCETSSASVLMLDGTMIRLAAVDNEDTEAAEAFRRAYPSPMTPRSAGGRAILTGRTVHIPDVLEDPDYEFAGLQRAGLRSVLCVPMLRHGAAIGAITVHTWATARPFGAKQMELLQTFADQAVIAVENVRLFTELGERNRDLTVALDQQTATSEILRVISSSQTDVQPVFDAIASSASRLCHGLFGALFRFDGELLHVVASPNSTRDGLEEAQRVFPARPTRDLGAGRAILEQAIVQIPDAELDPEFHALRLSRAVGWRSGLFVPMMREGAPIGVIAVTRRDPGAFADSEVELLKTFADQAVIAVENVRLVKELQARTDELTHSVSQLTALGEISRAVSSTLDVETVLQTVVSEAIRLAGSDGGAIWEYDDATQEFHIRATQNLDPTLVAALRASPLHRGEGAMGRAAETRQPAQVPDIQVSGAYQSHIRDTLLGAGYRALLSVPLLREDQIIGSLSLNRKAPGEFPAEVVEVLKTFATQSALAIQNARLFGEIEVKSRQLEAASQHKSEFLANMSHELRTPLNAIIGFSEVLNERMFGELNEKQDEYLKDIHASGTHLLSLINDILDLSKIEAGRMELELADFSLPAAIESSLTLVRERATRRGITLAHSVDAGVSEVRADERKVRQVLLNLLSNAIKFTPEGGRIEVRAVAEDGAVDVSVSDTGIGIAPEDQEAVFEEFRQVGSSAARQQGTGLGLTLCRKFVELHGGKIWVTSALGAGSTFTFRLPVRQG